MKKITFLILLTALFGSNLKAQFTETFDQTSVPAGWSNFAIPTNSSANAMWKFTGNPGYAMSGTTDHTGNNGSFAWVDGSVPSGLISVLESPTINISGSIEVSFWLKSDIGTNNTTHNTFTLEANDGGGWVTAFTFSANTLNGGWENFVVDLSSIVSSSTFQLRFNVNQNGSTAFYNDIALDDISVYSVSPPAPHNPGMVSLSGSSSYTQYPYNQMINNFTAEVKNFGFDTISGTSIDVSVLGTPYSNALLIDSMLPDRDTTVAIPQPFLPTAPGVYNAQAVVSCTQLDTLNGNDTAFFTLNATDTVIAWDVDSADGGIGNPTPISFGHRFSLNFPDTITSITYYLEAPTVGTKIRALLYTYNPITEKPDIILDSTRTFQVGSNSSSWYTQKLGCGSTVYPPGDYFIAMEQINPVNMSFGFSGFHPDIDYVLNYVDLNDGQGWLKSTNPALNPLLNNITFMLRVNLGHFEEPNVLGSDTTQFCFDSDLMLGKNIFFESYNWSTGNITDSIKVTTTGQYGVTVTDELGCTYTGSTYALENNDFNLFPNSTPTSSCGASDGQAQMIATGDNPPFSYQWSDGQSGVFATNLKGGSYDVSITDAIGCTKTSTVNILGAFPSADVTPSSPTCNGYFNGSATASITSGFAPYTFAWSSGGSSQVESGLGAGTYTISITDASGCTGQETVTITNPPIINVNTASSTNPTVCRGNDGIATATVSGGVAPYTFMWDNGKSTNSNISLSAGIYTVTVTDGVGCQQVETVTLSDPNAPSLSTSGSSVTCGDDSTGTASVNITGGTPPYNVLWSTNETSNNISNLPSGNYSVQVIDGAGCVSLSTATIAGPKPITALLTPNYDLSDECNSEIFLASISGGTPPFSYLWNDPNNQTTPSAVNLCNGTYELTVTDNANCTKTFTVIVYNPRTSINEESVVIDWLSVFPNPTNGQLNVVLNKQVENGTIKVISSTGAEILSIKNASAKGAYNLDLSNVAAGNYFIMIDGEDTHVVQQIQVIE